MDPQTSVSLPVMAALTTPLRLQPLAIPRPWGGSAARQFADLPAPPEGETIGEWWLASARAEATTQIVGGPFDGRTLAELLPRYGADLLGPENAADAFPLLIKILDTTTPLSVQLHPQTNDQGQAKTESWFFLDAQKECDAFVGLREGVSLDQFFQSVEAPGSGEFLPNALLQRHRMAAGDAIHIPAGMIHALGSGSVVLEVQQNSDTTYRIFDWNRQPQRDLHLEQARAAAAAEQRAHALPYADQPGEGVLIQCPHYSVERIRCEAGGTRSVAGTGRLQILVPLHDAITLTKDSESLPIPRGNAALIPASAGPVQVDSNGLHDRAESLRRLTPALNANLCRSRQNPWRFGGRCFARVPARLFGMAERLQKFLARCGIASRRKCEELITSGAVEVDGEIVIKLGTTVDPATQVIKLNGERVKESQSAYFAVNKPRGYVCSNLDPDGRPLVVNIVQKRGLRLFPVGRLDEQSEGLMLLTNDGDFAHRIAHPRHEIPKVYQVVVKGHADPAALDKLRKGVWLAEGKTKPIRVSILRKTRENTTLKMTLQEGRNRHIRRVLAKVELPVRKLVRIQIGPIRLGTLKRGEFRPLKRAEIKALYEGQSELPKTRSTRRPSRGRPAPAKSKRASQKSS